MELVDLRVMNDVAEVTFGDPARGNALTWEMARSVRHALESAQDDARCIVLRSGGTVFCSGADLAMLEPLGDHECADDVRSLIYESFQALIQSIVQLRTPVIARIQGPALGLGADLALACDLRVAASSAWLEESWIRLGTISALGGAHELASTLGTGDALDLLLTAKRLDAERAQARGVFQRVVPPADLDAEVRAVTQAIASRDHDAVRSMKALVRGPEHLEQLRSALERGLELQTPLIARPQFAERVRDVRACLDAEPPATPTTTVEPRNEVSPRPISGRAATYPTLSPHRTHRWTDFGQWDETFFPKLVGVVVEEIREGYCRMRVPWRKDLTQLAGVIHGGAIATLVDTVVVPAIGAVYDEGSRFLTVDLYVQYQGAVLNEDMVAEGWVTRRGRSVAFCEAEVFTASGASVARGMLTYNVSPPKA